MSDFNYGDFAKLADGKKGMTADEALLMLKQLGLLAQEFIPGAVSIRDVFEGKPIEALYDLQDWIPGNSAYQNWLNDKPQDWSRNAVDAVVMAAPMLKGGKKAMEMLEQLPKGEKAGFIVDPTYAFKKPSHEEATKKLAEAWTREAKETGKIARPQKIQSEAPTYVNPRANQYTDEEMRFGLPISKTYKDPETGKTVVENAAKLDAIKPENASEAAFVRHQKTAYDDRLKNIKHKMEADPQVKKDWRRTGAVFGWTEELPTIGQGWAEKSTRARVKAWQDLERQMPGYLDATLIMDPRAINP